VSNLLYDALFGVGARDGLAIETADVTLSFGQLDEAAARWAGALRELGVQPGDRVAVQVEKSLSNLLLYLGCVRAGAVMLPLNTGYTLAELSYFIDDAEPSLVVVDPVVEREVASIAATARTIALDARGRGPAAELADAALAVEVEPRGPDDLAAICYTSGTTGRSKGAMLTHRALESNARTLAALWGFTARDRLIHALPTYHVHGLFVATNVSLIAGGAMILQEKFDPARVTGAMSRATAFMGVPTHYTRLLASPALTREAAAGMRLFVSGSAPLLSATHRAFEARTGQRILERYGMTETGMNASNPLDGERRAGTVGFALPGVELRIVEEASGAPVAAGGIGGIEVRGPNVCSGYWRNPEKTAEAFRRDGFFVTGDLGQFDSDGYLSIVGRDKDLIITGGLNVYPKEVEDEIDAIPGVVESAVIGLPHPDFGEAVTAVVAVGPQPRGVLSASTVSLALAPRLARFKQPKQIIFIADLPRNAMGKVQKARLREQYADLYIVGGTPTGGSPR
jgi:malonyl-CoA/methylmalonyl-CoA synthetase